MTDTWYVFGAMVADPGFFPVIAGVNPQFTLIKMEVIENGGKPTPRDAAGLLDAASTTSLRRTFRQYAAAHLAKPAPVISLYTAGKFIQLSATLRTFPAVFTAAHGAFGRAGGGMASSVPMLTAMGLSLLDAQVAHTLLGGGVVAGDPVNLADELALQPAELNTLQAWVKDPGFTAAQTNLMSAACWTQASCLEDLMFYPGFERAVN